MFSWAFDAWRLISFFGMTGSLVAVSIGRVILFTPGESSGSRLCGRLICGGESQKV